MSLLVLLPFLFLNSTSLQSNSAFYEENSLRLEGDIVLEHPLGKVEAQIANFVNAELFHSQKDIQEIELKKNVSLSLKNGAYFFCESAHLFPSQQKATFFGNQPLVTYRDSHAHKKRPSPFFELKSPHIDAFFESVLETNHQSIQIVKKLIAHDKAYLNYDNTFSATADEAVYDHPQTITLMSKTTPASILHKNEDQILARKIKILTQEQLLTFFEAQGKMTSYKGLDQPLIFSCGTLIWDEDSGQVSLLNPVELNHGTLGHFHNENKVILQRDKKKNEFVTLSGTGFTTLKYLRTDNSNQTTFLKCHGQLLLDHQKLTAHLKSSSIEQVFLEDFLGEIHSDEVFVHYTKKNEEYLPTLIQLLGHVTMVNCQSLDKTHTRPVRRYAMADRVDYFLDTQEIIFNSSLKNQVLFFDQLNERYLSAKTIYITVDPVSKKEIIRGEGNMRLLFEDNEMDQFKKQFHFEE